MRHLTTLFVALILGIMGAPHAMAQWECNPPDAMLPDWRASVPRPVLGDSALVQLYNKSWEIASGRVRRGPDGMVASPYIDENCYDDQIWIWDGCFMVLFCKYDPEQFPGKETLSNYYSPIHDGKRTPLRIHLRDNPPLFAWAEHENIKFTGDRDRIAFLDSTRYLERHYQYYNNLRKGDRDSLLSPLPIFTTVHRDNSGDIIGYTSIGNSSGMDNTPRGRDAGGWDSIMWVDAICQQALAADRIAEIRRLAGDEPGAQKWDAERDRLADVINSLYWDPVDGFYYDITIADHKPVRVATLGSYWALLAGIVPPQRIPALVDKLRDPDWFGGERPLNSLSRSDADFDSITGNYWRGGIWLPMAYMTAKALERNGYAELADSLTANTVQMMSRVYQNTEPHTVWETYSPVADAPSTEHGHRVRQEFCGWSALGPISLLIENIMGFREANGLDRTLRWDVKHNLGNYGIDNLRFGPVTASLHYDPTTRRITVSTNEPFTLILPGYIARIPAGRSALTLPQ